MTGKRPKPRHIFLSLKRNLVRLIKKPTTRRIFWILLTPAILAIICFSLLLGSWWVMLDRPTLQIAKNTPVDSILVLGGSIQREIYVAELAKESSQIPILISSGSLAPCIWLIFQQAQAPMQKVWLQNCATSTFENYYFAVPLFKQWKVNHVKVITSKTHLPRAKWLAQIILGSQGIWVEMDLVPEQGVPGNRESWLKTALDVTRSFIWARVSQYYSPECSALNVLPTVDFAKWDDRGFKCEYQGHLTDTDRSR